MLNSYDSMNPNKNTVRIGILGGIGPEATGEFYLNLIKQFQKRGLIKSNEDFPQIIINSIPAPELIYDTMSEEDLTIYLKGLHELEDFGVDFIVMVCNTIHGYYDLLQSNINVPILDLRKEFREYISKNKIKSIVILGTPVAIKGDLFRVDNVRYFELDEEDKYQISKLIFNFNNGTEKEKQSKIAESIAKKYINRGAEIAVLGCTEISLMLKDSKIRKIDTMDILIDASLNHIPLLK